MIWNTIEIIYDSWWYVAIFIVCPRPLITNRIMEGSENGSKYQVDYNERKARITITFECSIFGVVGSNSNESYHEPVSFYKEICSVQTACKYFVCKCILTAHSYNRQCNLHHLTNIICVTATYVSYNPADCHTWYTIQFARAYH